MDITDLLRSQLQGLYKSRKSLKNTVNAVRQGHVEKRKTTRNTILLSKRQINEAAMSPYITPTKTKSAKKTDKELNSQPKKVAKVEPVVSERYQRLVAWKQERETKKLQEKKNAKPLFKVTHVPVKLGLPDLENINKQIKGKVINLNMTKRNVSYKFAPENHKFKPPINVKPVTKQAQAVTTANFSNSKRITRSQKDKFVAMELPTRRKKLDLHSTHKMESVVENRPKIKKVVLDVTAESKSATKVYKKTPAKSKYDKNIGTDKKASNLAASLKATENMPASASKTIDHVNKTLLRQTNKRKNDSERDSEILGNKSLEKKPTKLLKQTDNEKCKTPKKRLSNKNNKLTHSTPVSDSCEELLSDADQQMQLKNTVAQPDDNAAFEYTTPKKTEKPIVYVSPFVTISRGKTNARKEYFERRSRGGTCDSTPELRVSTGPKAGSAYFRKVLDDEIQRIQSICDEWTNYKDTEDPPEEAVDMINVAIGQSQLLINKKFRQFGGLINSCENEDSDVPVTCEDLHGFWDVAYMQVENLDKRFENLENLKRNNWEEIMPQATTVQIKKKLVPRKAKAKAKTKVTSSLKDAIKAARMNARSQQSEPENTNSSTFDGKFFTITSPHKSPLKKQTSTPGRKSMRAEVIFSEATKRKSTPAFNIIRASRISQIATANEGFKITPSRSILKIKSSQSTRKPAKSVLFHDEVRRTVNLNETYPPAALSNITNNEVKARKKTKRRSSRNKLV